VSHFKDLPADVTYICFGKEVGESGTPHLQGYLELKAKRRMNGVKELLGCARVHLAVSKGTAEENLKYCSKEDTETYIRGSPMDAIDGGKCEKDKWDEYRTMAKEGRLDEIPAYAYVRCKRSFDEIASESMKKRKVADVFNRKDWVATKWQHQVLEAISGPVNARQIVFVVGPPNREKSQYINHVLDYIPRVWTCEPCENGKVNDWAFEFAELGYIPTAVVIDCPMEIRSSDIPWRFIEKLKNGRIRSGKYTGGTFKFDPPHIVFFCNSELWKREDGECVIADDRVISIKLD